MDNIPAIIGTIGGLTGIIGLISFVVFYRENKKNLQAEVAKKEAETEQIRAETEGSEDDRKTKTIDWAFEKIDKLTNRVDSLESDLSKTKDDLSTTNKKLFDVECENQSFKEKLVRAYHRIEALIRGIKILLTQLEANQIIPAWKPDDWDENLKDG